MKELSVIVILYNSEKTINRCFESIKNSASENLRFNLIVIDNASVDIGMQTAIAAVEKLKISNVKFIRNQQNIGFARAVNQGLKYSRQKFNSDYFLLLNPDAYLKKDCLEKLIKKIASEENIGLVAPSIVDPKINQPWFSGAEINWFLMKTTHLSSGDYLLKTKSYLTGCCLLIKKSVIDKIRFFDESFFLYYEDVDFSLRAQKAGFKIALEEKAICYHQESQSSDSEIKNYHLVKSGLLFFHKYYPFWALPYFWLIFFLRFIYHRFFSGKKEVFRAMKDFFKK